jgi:transcriptional regulator with XRE-family HTH domain
VTQAPEGSPAGGTLAERVEWLIARMWPAGAPPPSTNASAAAAISAATGTDLSHTALWKLRTGRSDNPTLKTITALAAFFRVPPSYFTDGPDAEAVADQVALLALLRDAGVTGTALRALAEMPAETRRTILDMMGDASASGGQPPVGGGQ